MSKPGSKKTSPTPEKKPKKVAAKKSEPQFDLSTILEISGPKKPLSAYMCFTTEKFASKEHKDKELQRGDLFKAMGAEWSQLDETAKSKYDKLSNADQARYKAQLLEYEEKGYFIREDGQQSNHVLPDKKKFLDHVVMPKRNIAGFMFYMTEATKLNKEKHPDLPYKDVFKKSAEEWTQISDKDKKKFDLLAEKDKLRYESDFNDLLTKGYFMMPDGSKSSEHVNKKKVKKGDKPAKKNSEEDEHDAGEASDEPEEPPKKSRKRKAPEPVEEQVETEATKPKKRAIKRKAPSSEEELPEEKPKKKQKKESLFKKVGAKS